MFLESFLWCQSQRGSSSILCWGSSSSISTSWCSSESLSAWHVYWKRKGKFGLTFVSWKLTYVEKSRFFSIGIKEITVLDKFWVINTSIFVVSNASWSMRTSGDWLAKFFCLNSVWWILPRYHSSLEEKKHQQGACSRSWPLTYWTISHPLFRPIVAWFLLLQFYSPRNPFWKEFFLRGTSTVA